MLDRERILSKVAELDGYLRELDSIRPATRGEFEAIEKKRACERGSGTSSSTNTATWMTIWSSCF